MYIDVYCSMDYTSTYVRCIEDWMNVLIRRIHSSGVGSFTQAGEEEEEVRQQHSSSFQMAITESCLFFFFSVDPKPQGFVKVLLRTL